MTRCILTVNGADHAVEIEARMSLLDTLRERLGLTGARAGCEHGVCGACTILVDGRAVRSCLILGVQAEGARITTIEGLTPAAGTLSVIQDAFCETHGMQCGFCTPGMVIAAHDLLSRNAMPDREAIREAISANICRCTGYGQIIEAIELARDRLAGRNTVDTPLAAETGQ